MDIKIAPSILSADFSILGQEVESFANTSADYIHCDVMDGVYVKNITFGPKMVKDLKKHSTLPLDTHLMIVEPERYVEKFALSGADILSIHKDSCKEDFRNVIKLVKSFGVKCGAVLNPDRELEEIKDYIDDLDVILLMSVYPGFGGQTFIENIYKKIEKTAELIRSCGKKIDIEVDGGVTLENVNRIKSCGANVLVAGNTIFKAADRAKVIDDLKNI